MWRVDGRKSCGSRRDCSRRYCADDGWRLSDRPLRTDGVALVVIDYALPDRGARFYAVPVKIKGMVTFPIHAFPPPNNQYNAGQFCTALRYSSSACGIQLCNCWM